MTQLKTNYINLRKQELLQASSQEELATMVASLEFKLLDLSDSVLDDSHNLADLGIDDTLEGAEQSIGLLQRLDADNELEALWTWVAE